MDAPPFNHIGENVMKDTIAQWNVVVKAREGITDFVIQDDFEKFHNACEVAIKEVIRKHANVVLKERVNITIS